MNKKRLFKIVTIAITLILILGISLNNIYAFGINDLKGEKIENTEITNLGQDIVKIVTTIGSIISVIVLIILGIKYMMGSAEEKADYKKTMFPYVIGAVAVFGASALASIIYNVANSL